MKIAIPANGNDINSEVCISFGRTPYFIVVDTETEKFSVINNKAVSEQGGAGIKAAQAVADSGAAAVVTFHCGKNAADVLKAADIKIYKAVKGTVNDMVKNYNAGVLNELAEINAGGERSI